MAKADIIDYTKTWQNKEVPVSKLRVIFTALEEGSYCIGLMKMVKKNAAEMTAARENKFKVGSIFRASNVAFVDEKAQYVHTPFKLVLDLRNTTFAVLLTAPFSLASQPSPPSEVADIVSIKVLVSLRKLSSLAIGN